MRSPSIIRKKKHRILFKQVFKILMLVTVLILAAFILSKTHLFRINDVEIIVEETEGRIGNSVELVIYEKLHEDFFIFDGYNYYLFAKKKLIEVVKKDIWVDSVEIKATFLNKLKIIVKERELFGSYCKEGNLCLVVDSNGQSFLETGVKLYREINILDEINIGDNILDVEKFSKLSKIIKYLLEKDVLIKRVDIGDTSEVALFTEDGLEIRLSLNNSLYSNTRSIYIGLFKVLRNQKNQLDFIDIRIIDKIVYK